MQKQKVKSKQTVKVKSSPKNLTQKFIEVVTKRENLWFEECKLAFEIAIRKEEWKKLGYSSIKEYIDEKLTPKTGISYKRFMEKVKWGEAIDQAIRWGMEEEEIISLGSSKFRQLASLLNMEEFDGDVEKIVDEIKDLPVEEAGRKIKEWKIYYRKGEKVASLKLEFKLIDEQAEIVRNALKKAQELAGYEDLNQALVYICMDFLMNSQEDQRIVEQLKEEVDKVSEKAEEVKKKIDGKHNYSGRRK